MTDTISLASTNSTKILCNAASPNLIGTNTSSSSWVVILLPADECSFKNNKHLSIEHEYNFTCRPMPSSHAAAARSLLIGGFLTRLATKHSLYNCKSVKIKSSGGLKLKADVVSKNKDEFKCSSTWASCPTVN